MDAEVGCEICKLLETRCSYFKMIFVVAVVGVDFDVHDETKTQDFTRNFSRHDFDFH